MQRRIIEKKPECVLHWTDRNYRPYIVSSARNIVSKCCICVQILLVSEECFVVKVAEVSYLVSYYNTVGQIHQNSLKSRLNSPG